MKHEECPVATTLSYVGGKWKPIILFELRDGPLRTGELTRRIPQVSAKMLTQQLRQLERDGVVQRKIHEQVPPKVEYSLTPLGRSLRPVMNALASWGKARQKAVK
jgi:DNA-binding HxlR family transcriptional regulator